ncbi:MAG TPA: choice-of-anchor D domain-containing protein [Candidatus Acidoferrales bacterium]|nr:choice-of-anchor D domain-containing protein [Candidatus Acidoferrales bacterium]
MNKKIGLFYISCLFILVAIGMGGCVGYAGSVGPSSGSANTSSRGTVAAAPATVSFGSVSIGSNSTQSVSLTNPSHAAVVISNLSSSNAAFVPSGLTFPLNLAPGQSAAFHVGFQPTTTGDFSGTIAVASNASNSATMIGVSGSGTQKQQSGVIAASTATLSLGSVVVGSAGTQTFSVTNTGGMTATLSSVNSSSPAFAAAGPNFPMDVAPGQTVPFTVTFTPAAAGNASGVITVGSNASNTPTTVAVSATGVAAATSPTISSQPANQTVVAGQKATFSVTASGTGTLTYQWKKGGTAISGATSASYTTAATTSADNGASFTVAVSNSAGNVTSNAATLTVSAATLSLSANPTSVSFGSVNVGSNNSQSVTFTNNGNSDVTVSNVSVSGAGFNATGVSAGQVVAAGKTASLSVAFAPSGSGSLTGSVTVTSNAANSPLTVALSGTGASTAPPAVSGAPTCGKNNDTTNHVPTDWQTFVPPAKGQSYVDSTFGCTVTRITDVSSEDNGGSSYLPIGMGYATVSPFNANDTYLMLGDGWGRHFVTDLKGNVIVSLANMPSAYNDSWYYWDATDANVFYYTNGNSMMRGTISGSSVTTSVVHEFTEYSAVNFMDETDISQDGQHVVLIGGDNSGASPESVFDYNFVSNLKGPVYTTQSCTGDVNNTNNNCLHKLVQTPDNNVAIDFASDGAGAEQGVRLWDGTSSLSHLQNGTNHMDTGYDMNGSPVFIEVGNPSTVAGETNPCPSGWGLDVRQIYDTGSAVCLIDNQPSWHVGYRGNATQPWVGLSFFDQRTAGPEVFDNSSAYSTPNSTNWQLYEDEIMVVRVDANNNPNYIYRLARAYSRSAEDFNAQPHAALSRDGKYVAFGSNMAYAHTGCPANFQTSTNCADVYVIRIK